MRKDIKAGYAGFPEDHHLIDAITTSEMLNHVALAMSRLDTLYVQMIIDRMDGYASVALKRKHPSAPIYQALVKAFNEWLEGI